MNIPRGREGFTEAPYTGPLGVTRREFVFVPAPPDGALKRAEVVRALNVVTDPVLARQALDGALNRVDGVDLAVPYVFHDPSVRRFVLVVPPSRAHEELALRAELLTRLAGDVSEALPGYVREARAVVGAAGLKKYIEDSAKPAIDPKVLEALQQREDKAHKREHELRAMEQELQARLDEIEAAQNQVSLREQEVDQRMAEAVQREESVAGDEQLMRANMAALASREKVLKAREDELVRRDQDILRRGEDLDRRDQDITLREQEYALRSLELAPDELTTSIPIVPVGAPIPAPVTQLAPVNGGAPDDELDESEENTGRILVSRPPEPSIVVDDALIAPVPVATQPPPSRLATPASTPPAPRVATPLPLQPAPVAAPEPEPEPEDILDLSPDDVLAVAEAPKAKAPVVEDEPRRASRSGRAHASRVDGEVRVWMQGTADTVQHLASGTMVPVLQANPDGVLPLALLSVRGESGGVTLARVVLDATQSADRGILESLKRDFRVRVEVMNALGRTLGTYAVSAPCEPNAQRVLDLLAAREAGPPDEHEEAIERLLRDGIGAIETQAGAFTLPDEQSLATAAGVESALVHYEPLLDRARLERVAIARGISMAQIESLGRRLILTALRCGVLLSPAFVQRAVELGVAPDERNLATRALTAYARTVEGGVAAIGRTPEEASRAWAPLLAWADRVGVTVSDAVRDAVASIFNPDDPLSTAPPDARPAPASEAYAAMSDDELLRWVDHPEARLAVARELGRRDGIRFSGPIGRALRLLPAQSAAELAAELVKGGDALGDVWIELIASRRRGASAIGVVGAGVLHLRRALNPLVQRALAKDNEDWKLAAWAAGQFGVAAVRALTRVETDQTERLAWVLGHAVRCGAAKELERARVGAVPVFLEAGTRALALQDEVRAYDDALKKHEGNTEIERLVHGIVKRTDASDAL